MSLFEDEDLYDEFGNFIGEFPESLPTEGQNEKPYQEGIEGESAALETHQDVTEESNADFFDNENDDQEEMQHKFTKSVVLHEEKQYYPEAAAIYGKNVDIKVEEEDTQPLSEPVIKVSKKIEFIEGLRQIPVPNYSKEAFTNLSNRPDRIRNIILVGGIHTGKSTFIDKVLYETYESAPFYGNSKAIERYTDIYKMERDRGISLKSHPVATVVSDWKGRSYLANLIDTPGHLDFCDEFLAASRIVDGALLFVDACEGVTLATKFYVESLIKENLPFVLFLNKIDRLALELKLPPIDGYMKLRQSIEELNAFIKEIDPQSSIYFSPELGNVIFGATKQGFSFSLYSFAQLYSSKTNLNKNAFFDLDGFAKRLWGDIYYDESNRKFSKQGKTRSFIHFILNPLYKLFGVLISEEGENLLQMLDSLGIAPTKNGKRSKLMELNPKEMLAWGCHEFFGNFNHSIADLISKMMPSPIKGVLRILQKYWNGEKSCPNLTHAILTLDDKADLCIHVVKLFPTSDASKFDVFGRIYSGTLKKGQRVTVLGENFDLEGDTEDFSLAVIKDVHIYQSRFKSNSMMSSYGPGNLVLISGVDESILKTGTLISSKAEELSIFRKLQFPFNPLFKVSIEPVLPVELPKMLHGLRCISKTYPLLQSKVEESGEHVLFGSGELYLDCALADLRTIYSQIHVQVSDPSSRFCETVIETSQLKCFAVSANAKNKLVMIVEPIEKGLTEDIENGKIGSLDAKARSKFLRESYNWDILAARSFWALGPDEVYGPNILIDDTLPSEVDKELLNTVKDSIIQGFRWATREGPLIDEGIRGVKFKVIDADLSPDLLQRSAGQIIPLARRVCYSAFLTASPRLMEPYNLLEISVTNTDAIPIVYALLAKRRSHVTKEISLGATPFSLLSALIPVIDTAGFETDLRISTQGSAYVVSKFSHWHPVPGDPLDKNCIIPVLEPASGPALARDYMIKTRRRKGLSEDVSVTKYFDEIMLKDFQNRDLIEEMQL